MDAGRRGLTLSALGAAGGLALAGPGPARAQDPAPPPPAASVPGPAAQEPKRSAPRRVRPVRISIPAIGVRARVTRLGLNADRTLQVPKVWDDTGWWSGGPAPGQHGPAVIVGHVDSTSGPAVFHRLRDLRAADVIRVVRSNGSDVRFVVRRKASYSKRGFPTRKVYGRTKHAALRLITCDGDFDRARRSYERNLVVFATREHARERTR